MKLVDWLAKQVKNDPRTLAWFEEERADERDYQNRYYPEAYRFLPSGQFLLLRLVGAVLG